MQVDELVDNGILNREVIDVKLELWELDSGTSLHFSRATSAIWPIMGRGLSMTPRHHTFHVCILFNFATCHAWFNPSNLLSPWHRLSYQLLEWWLDHKR